MDLKKDTHTVVRVSRSDREPFNENFYEQRR